MSSSLGILLLLYLLERSRSRYSDSDRSESDSYRSDSDGDSIGDSVDGDNPESDHTDTENQEAGIPDDNVIAEVEVETPRIDTADAANPVVADNSDIWEAVPDSEIVLETANSEDMIYSETDHSANNPMQEEMETSAAEFEELQLLRDTFRDRCQKILDTQQWTDCTIVVGKGNKFPAHKLILAMSSPIFEAMFYGADRDEEKEEYKLMDMEPEYFSTFLNYIYTETINVDSFDTAYHIYICAKKYIVPALTKACIDYMANNITAKTACRAYEIGVVYEEKSLVESSLKVIETNSDEVLKTTDFNTIDAGLLAKIFSLDTLKVTNELTLLMILEKRARYTILTRKKRMGSPLTRSSKRARLEEVSITLSTLSNGVGRVHRPVVLDHDYESVQETTTGVNNNISNTNFVEELDNDFNYNDFNEEIFSSHALAEWSAVMSELEPALKSVRLLTVPLLELSLVLPRLGVVRGRAAAVLAQRASADARLPLPKGFSYCRIPRNLPTQTKPVAQETKKSFKLPVGRALLALQSGSSAPIPAGGLSWRLRVQPAYEGSTSANIKGCLEMTLRCENPDPMPWGCSVYATLKMMAYPPPAPPTPPPAPPTPPPAPQMSNHALQMPNHALQMPNASQMANQNYQMRDPRLQSPASLMANQNQQLPNQHMPNQHMPNQHMPNQHMPNQHMPNQHMPDQHMPPPAAPASPPPLQHFVTHLNHIFTSDSPEKDFEQSIPEAVIRDVTRRHVVDGHIHMELHMKTKVDYGYDW